ncbi:glycosyltransferase [Akkermansiaceae bacterium]|nr:glycosyltransferase [Akkermansiaceae bacterium]
MTYQKNALYIGGFRLPNKNAAAQRVIANGKLLKEIGYNVSYIDVDTNYEETKGFSENTYDGFKYAIKTQKYPQTKIRWISYIVNIHFIINAIENDLGVKPDIILVYNYPAMALYRLTKYCKSNKIKIVADITEWYFPKGGLAFKIIKGLDSYFRMHHVHKNLDGVIVISKYLERFYNDMNLIRLPPLVDKNSKKWELLNIKNIRNNSCCQLIYVGSISHGEKDRLDLVINSLNRIRDKARALRLLVIGVVKSDYLKFFGEKALPANVDDFVVFLGKRPHEDVIKHIKNSDYSIFLRSKTLLNTAGFPTKFVESLACGTPVLTNDSSDLSDYMVNGKTGFLLSNSNNETLDEGLLEALSVGKEKILEMKNRTFKLKNFHYLNYKDELNRFLSKI